MNLFILRHGIAAEKDRDYWGDDSQRPLTKKGISEIKDLARVFKKIGIKFDLILASPFVRARQTADIVAEKLKLGVRETKFLQVGGNPGRLIQQINKEFVNKKKILLVGHEPYLSDLISVLISGAGKSQVNFKKGAICKLSIEDKLKFGQCAFLEWLINPKLYGSFE